MSMLRFHKIPKSLTPRAKMTVLGMNVYFSKEGIHGFTVLEESVTSKDQELLLKSPILKGMATLQIGVRRSSLITSLN